MVKTVATCRGHGDGQGLAIGRHYAAASQRIDAVSIYTVAGLRLRCEERPHRQAHRIEIDDHVIYATATEYRILRMLLERWVHPSPDPTVPMRELLEAASLGDEIAALQRHICRLRSKLRAYLRVLTVTEDRGLLGYYLREQSAATEVSADPSCRKGLPGPRHARSGGLFRHIGAMSSVSHSGPA